MSNTNDLVACLATFRIVYALSVLSKGELVSLDIEVALIIADLREAIFRLMHRLEWTHFTRIRTTDGSEACTTCYRACTSEYLPIMVMIMESDFGDLKSELRWDIKRL